MTRSKFKDLAEEEPNHSSRLFPGGTQKGEAGEVPSWAAVAEEERPHSGAEEVKLTAQAWHREGREPVLEPELHSIAGT